MSSVLAPASLPLSHSFPPIENEAARVLVLGSMPGMASLRAGQYYAHPRNQFWPIMSQLLHTDLTTMAYPLRVQSLIDAGLALWDVLQSCQRRGSLDAGIAPASVVTHDFAGFFERHPAITHVYFNGAAAATYFHRHVRASLPATCAQPALSFRRLPSTSPAHAGMSLQTKLAFWSAIADVLGVCRTVVADSENRPQRGSFLTDSPPQGCSMRQRSRSALARTKPAPPLRGQEAGEKESAAVDFPLIPPGTLQPTIPKSDRLLGQTSGALHSGICRHVNAMKTR